MRGGRAVHKTYALPPYTLYYFLFYSTIINEFAK